MRYITWADHELEAGQPNPRPVDRESEFDRRSPETSRIPVPCCSRRLVGADMLVLFAPDVTVSSEAFAKVEARFPALAARVAADPRGYGMYLCDGCHSILKREEVLRDYHTILREMASAAGVLAKELDDAARRQAVLDSEFPSYLRDPTATWYREKQARGTLPARAVGDRA